MRKALGSILSVSKHVCFNLMAMKKYLGHCTGSHNGTPALHDVIVEAVNPPQARKFLEARYPGYTRYYTSSEVR